MIDAGSRLLFKFRSGTHGLNEELGRHRGMKERECILCAHVVLSVKCIYSACVVGMSRLIRQLYMYIYMYRLTILEKLLGNKYSDFNT